MPAWKSGLVLALLGSLWAAAAKPFCSGEFIFPLQQIHNHGSCIVECPNGDLLVCWYHGSGERKADDVVVLGSRLRHGAKQWSDPFLMADTPGYPDTNPAMFIDPQKRLWLMWPTILANRWESALMKYRVSSDYQKKGPPKWSVNEVLHITPGPEFSHAVTNGLAELASGFSQGQSPAEFDKWAQENLTFASDRLACRLGWMTRVHPVVLDNQRLIVPLYSDGFNFSLMAITDDWGKTWETSAPLIGLGNVQPSLVRKGDGTLVAFMRDNGPPPQRVQVSRSADRGKTWSKVTDSDRVDPGAGVEALVLKSGLWLLIHNDLERGRHSLAVSLSDDEGATWKWTRHLERDTEVEAKTGAGSYHYPSIIQARDGTLHASYSYQAKSGPGTPSGMKTIKHAHFNDAWIKAGGSFQP